MLSGVQNPQNQNALTWNESVLMTDNRVRGGSTPALFAFGVQMPRVAPLCRESWAPNRCLFRLGFSAFDAAPRQPCAVSQICPFGQVQLKQPEGCIKGPLCPRLMNHIIKLFLFIYFFKNLIILSVHQNIRLYKVSTLRFVPYKTNHHELEIKRFSNSFIN